ncbi:OsmC family protein [Undibacterium pigrum]|uniref:Organic hydroperoxide reductase OsmC/OhrA n=1 Tax=Undibacterium pigrum TaxID=401470 RepID=A0A318J7Y3_9BURK|nr:OsmC family protein [Undibacterium pigrum]PXX43253.1 organic hydroperoxide reductase OsmC/OhrA [Undibacterium pigrum]
MHQYQAKILWERGEQAFSDNRYSRAHAWEFDGGLVVPASSSPLSVPVPMSEEKNVDPEEALVAALASCHMLFYLSFVAKRGYVVDQYRDLAVGVMDKNAGGKTAITRIHLRPQENYSGDKQPNLQEREELHHMAHEHCYIANSIHAEVIIEIE